MPRLAASASKADWAGLSEKKEQAEKLEETTRQEKILRVRVSELETADAELVGEYLGQDAQIWLFSRAKAVVFDDHSHLRQSLGRATCWSPIRSVKALSFRYYNNELLGKSSQPQQ